MMHISNFDANFREKEVAEDIEWLDVTPKNIKVFGLINSDKEFLRMPLITANAISANVAYLATHTAGGRIVIKTNSPFIAIKGYVKNVSIMSNMALYGVYGFSVYEDGLYRGTILPKGLNHCENIAPDKIDLPIDDEFIFFNGKKELSLKKEKCVQINFPLYTGAKEISIGINRGSFLENCNPYKNDCPIVFYGSSITQGACASRAGLEYVNLVSSALGYDYINLGFAGNCKGEREMAEYISCLNACLYIIEYDHNADSADYLRDTHFKFYDTLRKNDCHTPIIFFSRPSTEYYSDSHDRKIIIKNTYQKAKKSGDNNVYFIDGRLFYGKKERTLCSADTCHPNDIGFYRMQKVIVEFIKNKGILKI